MNRSYFQCAKPRLRGERGAAAVEFALVSLVFFTMLFGATERSVHATVAATSRALTKRVLRAVGNISLSNFIG